MNVGVLLAAGASSRMGSPKALVAWKGRSFLTHGVRALWAACDTVIVVLGSNAPKIRAAAEKEFAELVESGELTKDLHAARRKGSRGLEVRFENNPQWKSGMLSSARRGLADALALKPKGVLVLPVDHPEVRGTTVAQLAEWLAEALGVAGSRAKGGLAYALVPRHDGHRGHPLALSPALARAIVADRRAKDLGDAVRRSAKLVGYLDVADPGVVRNRNTPKG